MGFNQNAYDLGQQHGQKGEFDHLYANGANSQSYISGWVQGTTERSDYPILEVGPVAIGDRAFECDECGALIMNLEKHREWHRPERIGTDLPGWT